LVKAGKAEHVIQYETEGNEEYVSDWEIRACSHYEKAPRYGIVMKWE
jgi:hypothetical protein